MPLEYDDIPGSWGLYSEDWPCLVIPNKEIMDLAFRWCGPGKGIPYGSYVRSGIELRVENLEYLRQLREYVNYITLEKAIK